MNVRRFRALERTWEAHGRIDPFFGILSDPAKHGGRWAGDEFFASGRAHVENLFRTLSDLRVPFARDACLDFGCGVGRLTVPLSDHFSRTVGVDIASSMIDRARQHNLSGDRCEFIVNREPDLGLFSAAMFDVVHSSLVLQHMSPETALGYIREFFRVCKPGGLVVFQLPAELRPGGVVSTLDVLPASGQVAAIAILDPRTSLEPSQFEPLRVVVTNRSTAAWRHDIPGGRHIAIGNHWLYEDGRVAIRDDARAYLPRTIVPGESLEVPLRVQAPEQPGRYVLEVDLVQELVSWFADRGSETARVAVTVSGPSVPARSSQLLNERPPEIDIRPAPAERHPRPRASVIKWILRRFRHKDPFEMFTVPRAEVERVIHDSGGDLLRAIDDNAAGPNWGSYTYVCRRQ